MNNSDIKRHRLATSALSRFNDITDDVSGMPQRMSTGSLFLLQNAFSFLSYYESKIFEDVNSNNKLCLSRWLNDPYALSFPFCFSNLLVRDSAVILIAFSKAMDELAVSYKCHTLKSKDQTGNDKFLLSTKVCDTTYFFTNTGIFCGLIEAIKSTGYEFSNVTVVASELSGLQNSSITYNFFPRFKQLIVDFDIDGDKSIKIDAVKFKERQKVESNTDTDCSFTRYSNLLLNALILSKK
ncbi:hypothetical protein GLP31_18190 [Photobacterium carnosum]|uniref:hypothetical protein n=1 Tax=Photobacterium carnosum TaxID=2023717 RepID=UPI001E3C5C76|nr:hypothetical protein [Photobacterium carnosum]MCD9554399.1 hypothetical protein [Photobacterium carnosum]